MHTISLTITVAGQNYALKLGCTVLTSINEQMVLPPYVLATLGAPLNETVKTG